MSIPKLKRIKVSSVQELTVWLSTSAPARAEVMIVTCDSTSKTKHVSSAEVGAALTAHGWARHASYTLPGGLVGHVIAPA